MQPNKYMMLQVVQVFFATATYDHIERDEKITVEVMLGLFGGTMGLFTGFSLLSGVEVLYFVFKFFLVSGAKVQGRLFGKPGHKKPATNRKAGIQISYDKVSAIVMICVPQCSLS